MQSVTVSYKSVIQMLHLHMWEMYQLLTSDPIAVRDNCDPQSKQERDFSFGLSDDDSVCYRNHADKFHRLFCCIYNPKDLTPYMMKLIDVAPILLNRLPFRSMMRLATEAGEHHHYKNMMYFYQHTLRGGGKNRPTVLKALFKWQWRCLCHRIREGPSEVSKAFDEFIDDQLRIHNNDRDNDGNTTIEEPCQEHEPPATNGLSVLTHATFILAGRLKTSHERLASEIQSLGGRVCNTSLPDERIPIKWVVISTQSECDKDPRNAPHQLANGFRPRNTFTVATELGWTLGLKSTC